MPRAYRVHLDDPVEQMEAQVANGDMELRDYRALMLQVAIAERLEALVEAVDALVGAAERYQGSE